MGQKAKVVIADLSENFQTLVSNLLKNDGSFEIVGTTGDGTQAMKLIKEYLPDIVLTDLILSGADGFSLLENAAEMPGDIRPKIIVISSFTSDHIVSTAKALGAAYFIQKSCEPIFLLSRIKMLLNSYTVSPQSETFDHAQALCKSSSVERAVTDIMHEIGIPAHIKGYQYLREAIVRAVENNDTLNAVTKQLYPEVASRFHTTASRVERAIRNAIEIAWNRGGAEVLQKYFGYSVNSAQYKPTNTELIALMADMLSLNQRSS